MPKIVDHEQYREELLEKCFHLFSEKGFSKVTMREIAKEAGISTGAMYHYFPSKHAILEQMFLYVAQRDVAEASARTSVSGSFEHRLELFFEFFLERQSNFQRMLLLSIDFIRNYDSEDSERLVAQWATYYIQSMQLYLEIPEAIAMTIGIYLNGLVYQTKLCPSLVPVEEQVALFRDMLTSYLLTHNDPKNRVCKMCPFMGDHPQAQATVRKGEKGDS
ncbi:MAG: TetR/AcrR family transcriptional regulator [Deltaproteobacteria bacterium]|nr:TetR/AcrR family transcriptional regulator [Deltaproteobacteria bacterium]